MMFSKTNTSIAESTPEPRTRNVVIVSVMVRAWDLLISCFFRSHFPDNLCTSSNFTRSPLSAILCILKELIWRKMSEGMKRDCLCESSLLVRLITGRIQIVMLTKSLPGKSYYYTSRKFEELTSSPYWTNWTVNNYLKWNIESLAKYPTKN